MIHPSVIYVDPRAEGKQFNRGSKDAAGHDISIFPRLGAVPLESITIPAGETVMVNTGVMIWIGHEPGDYFGMVVPRSSVGHRLNVMLGNTTGIIDSDYQGELLLSLHNRGKEPLTVNAGDRMAQIIFMPYLRAVFHSTEEFTNPTLRSTGGYGSTGR